ncbi:MAG: YnbE family lipoprotein [Pseudomonadales bacterium]|nr:YnbE family lipoprotein [Pseudomonadales bacterium]
MRNAATETGWRHGPGIVRALVPLTLLVVATACTPTVKVATDEPITINLNVNIKHEIRVKVDKELDDLFSEDSGLF